MSRDRLVQFGALFVMIACIAASGALLPSILADSRDHYLRYTDEPLEGAPPIVAVGQAIGALRGIIVDGLWIDATIMKDKGLFYEAMALADMITKLQPRFASVWAFHGHNMAYNISVSVNTPEDRWEWVKAGIDLVRNQGLRYNPNDLQLHRELAFWFKHKIEGYSDDAHLYYKRQFRREWHEVLGEPPYEQEARIAWIKRIADAPETLDEAEQRTPGVKALVERLRKLMSPYEQKFKFALDRGFLQLYSTWSAIKQESAAAQIKGLERQRRETVPVFREFDDIASDPASKDAWEMLVAHVRKRVLKDEYNMDPQLMYEFTRDLGPLDWRHGEAHALYWSRKGSIAGEKRIVTTDDYFKIVNNDRIQIQAMQALARGGRITFDPFDDLSDRIPSQFPDPRWIDVIDRQFEAFVRKHHDIAIGRGMRQDMFIDFFENFMSSAVREYYRSGYPDKAQRILDKLDRWFGTTGSPPNPIKYTRPLDVFVREETQGQYESQPELARSDVGSALQYGFRVGLGDNQPEVYENAKKFCDEVIRFFKSNEMYNYVNRFGEGRIKSLMGSLEDSLKISFVQVITDPSVPIPVRITIWNKVDEYEPGLRLDAYAEFSDYIRRELESQLQLSAQARGQSVDQVFPPPLGWEQRQQELREQLRRRQEQDKQKAGSAPMPSS